MRRNINVRMALLRAESTELSSMLDVYQNAFSSCVLHVCSKKPVYMVTEFQPQTAAAAPVDDGSEPLPPYTVPPSDADDGLEPTAPEPDDWSSLYLKILSTAGYKVDSS